MALVEIMRQWSEGVAAADKGDWSNALKLFTSIADPRSKICFNIGCCNLVLGDLHGAEQAFASTIEKDKHLAVGYFQRGSVFFKKGKYSEALEDLSRCFTELRGNLLIDYKILGLTFKLYSCEILHNIAFANAKMGNWEKAEKSIILALSQKAEPRHGTKIEKAMQEILKQKAFLPFEMPPGRLFQPNERLVEQLEKKDYLGKATVVASVVDKDSFSGFAPLQPQKGIVPCNYLEPVELRFQSQTQGAEIKEEDRLAKVTSPQQDIPAPPTSAAPAKVQDKPDRPVTKEKPPTCPAESSASYVVKVYYKYTVAIQVSQKLSYDDLLILISSKLKLTPCAIKLHFIDGDKEVALSKDNVDRAWAQTPDKCLKLKCTDLQMEQAPEKVEDEILKYLEDKSEITVTAMFDYEASQLEDLSFKKGDIIKVLNKVSPEWWEGECHKKVGIFPSAFVQ
ncbi:neutrophil cytosol factor 2 isoform X3 [Anomaloglossus baeobatrachus]|uniref:neutrophil cytosol factor 2 isoform X3 n=1 Tax=Anomaloglossus baeobatrachus TaxID=238106 RepID=UPI003F4F57AD